MYPARQPPEGKHPPLVERQSVRITLRADVTLRRAGQNNFRVTAFDVSRHGCRLEFVDRPVLDDRVWVKFDGLESLESVVCWIEGSFAGIRFVRPIHDAVFDLLIGRLRKKV